MGFFIKSRVNQAIPLRHDKPFPPPQVTRVSVIDHRSPVGDDDWVGLVFEAYNAKIRTELQDEGRTLKVWVTDA